MTMHIAPSGNSERLRSVCAWPLPLALVAVVAGLWILQAPRTLDAATTPTGTDTDGDGLIDVQEVVIGTSPDYADTDGDGYSDLEELARHRDPLDDLVSPAGTAPQVALFGHAQDGIVTAISAVYVPGGQWTTLAFELGVVINGIPTPLPPASYAAASQWGIEPGADGMDVIMVLQTQFPESLVVGVGSFAIYALVGETGGPALAADALNLVHVGGTTMSVEAAPQSIQAGDGVVYKPLSGGDDVPPGLTPGQICWKLTEPVGLNGAEIVYEVVDANCEDSDSYCSPAECVAGGTISVVDPGVLIGG